MGGILLALAGGFSLLLGFFSGMGWEPPLLPCCLFLLPPAFLFLLKREKKRRHRPFQRQVRQPNARVSKPVFQTLK